LPGSSHRAGITKVWMQQGSQSDAAIEYCQQNGIEVVSKRCIMMFAEPAGQKKRGAAGRTPHVHIGWVFD
jgi:predicted CoA-binding protein